jgi:two-component sensor histidine kinase
MKHRIKNSLATVQAIATQTLNQHANERDAFIARLHALGNAHDLLTSETWEKASLQASVTQALKPFQEQRKESITVDGPDEVWLIVTFGVGWVQRWGGPIEEIRPGDVVWFIGINP